MNPSSSPQLRPARIDDIPQIARIINDAAELGQMLPRSLASLYEKVRDFYVFAEIEKSSEKNNDEKHERIVGVCGLTIIWANLAEVASLVVSPDYRGHGLGGKLVQACLTEAHDLGIRKVMTLTYEQAFFERQGFTVVDRQALPLKVWSECVRCPKSDACDEIAMIRIFEDIPAYNGPAPGSPPTQTYVVPTVARKPK